MGSVWQTLSYFFRLPFDIQWRTAMVQLPRFVPLSILHFTSPKGPHPFIIALPSRKSQTIPLYVFVPPQPVDLGDADSGDNDGSPTDDDEWKVPVVLDFHGGGFIMGSPLEQAPYCAMMSRKLGAVVISVSYRIGPFNQFPSAIHDGEDVLSAILDTDGVTKAGKILRTEIQRYYDLMRECSRRRVKNRMSAIHHSGKSKITLDPTHLAISGFSAGGNLALNLAMSVPALEPQLPSPEGSDSVGPLIPPPRTETVLDDPSKPWPSVLPHTHPRLIPLLLFYPSLDARLLPHERPARPLPNSLNAARDAETHAHSDGQAPKPKVPGLFSIMSPTYLPKKHRAHPRASPGLSDPSRDLHKNAAIFLVLAERDSLAVQSDVWVDKMNEHGWTGPVRFGDEARDADRETEVEEGGVTRKRERSRENGGLEVWHAPGCRHGWTQFPGAVLGDHEKKERNLAFKRTLEFVRESWDQRLEAV